SDSHNLPCHVWSAGDHGLTLHEIRSSEPVSDNASGLSHGVSGRGLSISSGNGHRYFIARSFCGQTDRIVPFIRTPFAGVLESYEATWASIALGLARIGNKGMALREGEEGSECWVMGYEF